MKTSQTHCRALLGLLAGVSCLTLAGCAAGNLREPKDVLELDRNAGVVERFPISAERLAALLPAAAHRAGWSVEKEGGTNRPWVLELPWGFNETGIWARAIVSSEGETSSSLRVTAIVKNDIDRAEDVEGHTRLLLGWVVVTAQARAAGAQVSR